MDRPYVEVVGCDLQSTRFEHEITKMGVPIMIRGEDQGVELTQIRFYVELAAVKTMTRCLVLRLRKVPVGAGFYVRLAGHNEQGNGNFPRNGLDPGLVFLGTAEYHTVWVVSNLHSDEFPRLLMRCRHKGCLPWEKRADSEPIEAHMIPESCGGSLNDEPIFRVDDTGQFRLPWWWVLWCRLTGRG